jgi:hypothetical protein
MNDKRAQSWEDLVPEREGGHGDRMEMHQIRYFLAVADALNFTRAAEQCNVSQPALARAIPQLEEELGGLLLRRERKLTHLTDSLGFAPSRSANRKSFAWSHWSGWPAGGFRPRCWHSPARSEHTTGRAVRTANCS